MEIGNGIGNGSRHGHRIAAAQLIEAARGARPVRRRQTLVKAATWGNTASPASGFTLQMSPRLRKPVSRMTTGGAGSFALEIKLPAAADVDEAG
jgi:hypothetical protein